MLNKTDTIRATMTRRLLGEASGPLSGIYIITHRATGRRYVGQSLDIARRWAEHRAGTSGSRRLTNALKKHGPDAFDWEIVELCAPEELNDRELFYISAYGFDSLSPQGYNLTYGGEGVTFTPEVRARHAAATRRLAQDPEWREKQAATAQRLGQDPEWRANNSTSKKNSPAVRDHLAAIHSTPELKTRRIEAVRRANAKPERRKQLAEMLARIHTDPEIQARRIASIRNSVAVREAHADPAIYTIINVKTGERDTGTRLDFRDRHGIDGSRFGDLLRGTYKTSKGWRLALPEEIES